MTALGGAAAGGVMGDISQGIGYAQNRGQMPPTSEQGSHHLTLGTAQDMAAQVAEMAGATETDALISESNMVRYKSAVDGVLQVHCQAVWILWCGKLRAYFRKMGSRSECFI